MVRGLQVATGMHVAPRRSARLLASALCLGLLLALPLPAAAGGGRQFFVPVESKAAVAKPKNASSRLRRLGKKPIVRHLLHPLGTVRAVSGKARVRLARGIQALEIARLESKLKKGAAPGDEPSMDEVRHHAARMKKWRHEPSRHDEASALLADRVAVMSHKDLATRLSKDDLLESASALEQKMRSADVLLPVGMDETHMSRLISMGIAAVVGREIYGAPEGIASVLENDLVAFSVVDRTLEGARSGDRSATAWLTEDQRAVLTDHLAEGNEGAARQLLGHAYRSGVEVALSADRTYRTEEIHMDGGELPLSLRAAIGKKPELAAALRALEKKGLTLRVRTMVKTPPGVKEAALEYGAFGEETEFSPFVELVEKGLRPDPRPTPMGIMRAIASGRFSQRKPPTARDLEQRVDLIEQAVSQVLVIEAVGNNAETAVDELARINGELEPVRRLMAVHRIVFDVKHEAGEGARKLLKGVGALAATATALQAAGAGEGAILLAEGGEDALQGLVEGASQDGQMRAPGEVWRPSTKIAAVGALALSAYLAGPIHHLAEHGMGYAAGPLMGVGSMALSGTVFANAVALNKRGRVERLKAGKVADTVPQLMFDKGFQRQLRRIGKKPGRRRAILDEARRVLRAKVADGAIDGAEMTRTLAALEASASDAELASMVTMPGRLSIWRAALGEALGTPTRKALGQGMILTIVASSAVGAAGLLSGPAWGMAVAVMASAGEGIWGLIRSYRFEKENRKAEEKALAAMAAGA
jgi:hypothetical protein